MTTDYRAELQKLVQAYDDQGGRWPQHHEAALFDAVEVARAALAQPEPVGPTDEELDSLAEDCLDSRDYARAVLARWGRQPAPDAPAP